MIADYPQWILALAAVMLLAWLLQLVLQLTVWMRMAKQARRQTQQPVADASFQPGVSILVYAHNEAEALDRNLPLLLSQDYPDFEVIVIDDCSVDNTQDVLKRVEQDTDRLVRCHIDSRARAMSHRKLAVLLGAKASHHEVLLMTHAECQPASDQWIRGMVSHLADPKVEMVIGPAVLERRKGVASGFCGYDVLHRLRLLMGIGLLTRPFAGWGQNMAFRRETFYANRSQGFQRHLKMQPGEDDLFVADVARADNVAVECRPTTLMTDQSRHQEAAWAFDRLNRGYTSRLYARTPAVLRGLDSVTRYLTVLPAWTLIAYTLYIIYIGGASQPAWVLFGVSLALLLLRCGLLVYTQHVSARALCQRPQPGWALLLDLYTPLMDVWYRCKALIRRESFGVGHIGLL